MRRSVTILLLSWLAGAAMVGIAIAQNQNIAVIVNPKNPVTNVSSADLRKIFAGEKRSWPGGTKIKLIVRLPGCRERLVLLRILGMSESEYKQYWTAQVFRGEADAEPLGVPSFGMVREAAAVFPGAIGLVEAQNVRPDMNLKVIRVDRLLPGDSGYPVH
jgi:ABC-type phosphate transport system substrate-binding protein